MSEVKKEFIGGNLKNLRILYGYSLPSLAAKTSIPEHELWLYENKNKQPSFEHINILKVLFNVKVKYFYQPDLLQDNNNIKVEYISFRF